MSCFILNGWRHRFFVSTSYHWPGPRGHLHLILAVTKTFVKEPSHISGCSSDRLLLLCTLLHMLSHCSPQIREYCENPVLHFQYCAKSRFALSIFCSCWSTWLHGRFRSSGLTDSSLQMLFRTVVVGQRGPTGVLADLCLILCTHVSLHPRVGVAVHVHVHNTSHYQWHWGAIRGHTPFGGVCPCW